MGSGRGLQLEDEPWFEMSQLSMQYRSWLPGIQHAVLQKVRYYAHADGQTGSLQL